MLPDSIKDDFKAIHNEMMNLVAIATTGDPDKLIEFPKKKLIDTFCEAAEFRLYMLNADNNPVMILPKVNNKEMEAIITIAQVYSSLSDEDRAQGIKNLAGSMKRIAEKIENGVITLTDIFQIWLFTGRHLVGCYEIDATTACLLALSSAHLNSYDHIRDEDYVNGLIDEAVDELDGGL
ncbi:MAG: hypothetical protein WC637_00360 [Victivallales bacterium]|jgi:hypothetical protein